jgi:hypothetical protein
MHKLKRKKVKKLQRRKKPFLWLMDNCQSFSSLEAFDDSKYKLGLALAHAEGHPKAKGRWLCMW